MAEDQQPRRGDRLESLDKEIRSWALLTKKQLLGKLTDMGLDDRTALARGVSRIRFKRTRAGNSIVEKEKPLMKSVAFSLRRRDGEIERISFRFVRHGIFLEHGVGKGRPAGSSPAREHKAPWLSLVLPDAIEELADRLAEEYADIAIDELRFRIPGILEVQTKRNG